MRLVLMTRICLSLHLTYFLHATVERLQTKKPHEPQNHYEIPLIGLPSVAMGDSIRNLFQASPAASSGSSTAQPNVVDSSTANGASTERCGSNGEQIESNEQHRTSNAGSLLKVISYREGQFSDITTFTKIPDTLRLQKLDCRPADENLDLQKTGKIVYISDPGRLNNRVMLIFRIRPLSFGCLTFCLHNNPVDREDHWPVRHAAQADERGAQDGVNGLKIILYPYGQG